LYLLIFQNPNVKLFPARPLPPFLKLNTILMAAAGRQANQCQISKFKIFTFWL